MCATSCVYAPTAATATKTRFGCISSARSNWNFIRIVPSQCAPSRRAAPRGSAKLAARRRKLRSLPAAASVTRAQTQIDSIKLQAAASCANALARRARRHMRAATARVDSSRCPPRRAAGDWNAAQSPGGALIETARRARRAVTTAAAARRQCPAGGDARRRREWSVSACLLGARPARARHARRASQTGHDETSERTGALRSGLRRPSEVRTALI